MALRLARWLRPFKRLFPNHDPFPTARRLIIASETPGALLLHIPDRLGVDEKLAALGEILFRLGIIKPEKVFYLIPGVVEMLQTLQPQYPMSIVSARGRQNTLAFLEAYNLTQFFTCVASAQTCKHTKPYPDPILWAAAQMELSPDSCLMIGDTAVDVRAGKAAGAQTVGVLCGFGDEKELLEAGADLILPGTTLLPQVLSGAHLI
jgi:phosphoglycolate phosphatase-like HAD superfamily hydrolase